MCTYGQLHHPRFSRPQACLHPPTLLSMTTSHAHMHTWIMKRTIPRHPCRIPRNTTRHLTSVFNRLLRASLRRFPAYTGWTRIHIEARDATWQEETTAAKVLVNEILLVSVCPFSFSFFWKRSSDFKQGAYYCIWKPKLEKRLKSDIFSGVGGPKPLINLQNILIENPKSLIPKNPLNPLRPDLPP